MVGISMEVEIISAIAANGVIGKEDELAMKSKEDMAFFKAETTGHAVLMGRKTFDSLPGPLIERLNIVITRNPIHQPNPVDGVVYSDDLFGVIKGLADNGTYERLYIVGGAEIYKQALDADIVDRMILTRFSEGAEGDTHFPYFNQDMWDVEDIAEFKGTPAYRVLGYTRIR